VNEAGLTAAGRFAPPPRRHGAPRGLGSSGDRIAGSSADCTATPGVSLGLESGFGTPQVGNPSALTGKGVLAGMGAALEQVFGSADLNGRTVAVQGLGAIGEKVAEGVVEGGARVIATDIDENRAAAVASRLGLELVEPEQIYDVECDVFSPNAAGEILNQETIPRLRCRIVAGGANSQLQTPADGQRLHDRAILYAPDYIVNAGGALLVAGRGELGYSQERVLAGVEGIASLLRLVLERAEAEQRPTAQVANEIAEGIMAAGARARTLSSGPDGS
jgi:leucine dehydrogenase